MSRLTFTIAVCALIAAPALTRATEVERTVSPAALKGANPAECAQANSDFERYELGCLIDEATVGPAASNDPPSD